MLCWTQNIYCLEFFARAYKRDIYLSESNFEERGLKTRVLVFSSRNLKKEKENEKWVFRFCKYLSC